MQARMLLALLLLSGFFLCSCGGRLIAPSPANSYSAIDGNWDLVGEPSAPFGLSTTYPSLNLTMGVVGNTVYAVGQAAVQCSPTSAIGVGLSLTGQIASDGTFRATNSASPLAGILVTIQGTVPAAGASTWNGNFTIAGSSTMTNCTVDQSGSFDATLYPALNGSYAGTFTGLGGGSGVTLLIQVAQGAITALPGPASAPIRYYAPLSGTISVSGSPCFTTGTASNSFISEISGTSFWLFFAMNDGSTLQLSGWFADPGGKTLQIDSVLVLNGPCSGAGGGTLTRQ